jgi:DNA polymerase/3'-5' exonuclease PolX
LQVVLVGSYRRGKQDCGDVDLLLTHPNATSQAEYLPKLIQALADRGGLIAVSFVSVSPSGTWRGVVKLPKRSHYRRLDVFWGDPVCLGSTLLAYTGSERLNRSMRLLAHKFGWSLSEGGLSIRRGKNETEVAKQWVCRGRTEEEIFQKLQLEFIPPHERHA